MTSKTLPPERVRGVEWLPAITIAGMPAACSRAKPSSASASARGVGRGPSNRSPACTTASTPEATAYSTA